MLFPLNAFIKAKNPTESSLLVYNYYWKSFFYLQNNSPTPIGWADYAKSIKGVQFYPHVEGSFALSDYDFLSQD